VWLPRAPCWADAGLAYLLACLLASSPAGGALAPCWAGRLADWHAPLPIIFFVYCICYCSPGEPCWVGSSDEVSRLLEASGELYSG
jgi:hypothetical protein